MSEVAGFGGGLSGERGYLQVMRGILDGGVPVRDRTGVGTLATFGRMLRFDLSKGFPLLTTKKVHWKSVAHELLWFLSGDTNIRYLKENGVSIWDEWADAQGNLGPVYGKQWRAFEGANGVIIDQIAQVVEGIRSNPASRRHVVSAWNPAEVERMKLPPCHYTFVFTTQGNRLSCMLLMRSADWFLGVPFNIASYSLLTHMVAHQVGMEVGDFVLVAADAHLYENHLEQAKTQLARSVLSSPRLEITRKPKSIFDYRFEDFSIVGYDPHPAIKAAVAV